MRTLKARGSKGRWFAAIEGEDEEVPCVWDHWLTDTHYADPGAEPSATKWQKYFAAIIRLKRVALTEGGPGEEGQPWKRGPYKALYRVENVSLSDRGLEFDLVDRIALLK
jgi:hypothetical protein